jgi:hypothetical protein
MPKYVITIGTLRFEQGTYSYGETVELTEDRAKLFDKRDIRLIPPEIIEAANTPPSEMAETKTATIKAKTQTLSAVKPKLESIEITTE